MIPTSYPDAAEMARLTARMLLEIKAVHLNADEPFILASGLPSPTYIDCRKLISYPRIRSTLMDFLTVTVMRNAGFEAFDNIAGGETAIVDIQNSILAKNSAALGGPDCFMASAFGSVISSGGHNILGDASGCDFQSSTGDQIGDAGNPIDPLIGPLADNGGPTETHALLAGSPAVDAIPVADCTYDDDGDPGTPEVPLTEDQRGVANADRDHGTQEISDQDCGPGQFGIRACADDCSLRGSGIHDFYLPLSYF